MQPVIRTVKAALVPLMPRYLLVLLAAPLRTLQPKTSLKVIQSMVAPVMAVLAASRFQLDRILQIWGLALETMTPLAVLLGMGVRLVKLVTVVALLQPLLILHRLQTHYYREAKAAMVQDSTIMNQQPSPML